jgi:hypothetical protein
MSLFATAFTCLLVLVFLARSVRAIRQPAAAAEGFGVPPTEFVPIYGSRNLALGAAALALLALHELRGLAVLLTCVAPLTLFDLSRSRHKARHAVALVLLTTAAALWWVTLV